MDKKIALITGGRRGIGFGISKKLGLDGYHVILVSISDDGNVALYELRKLNVSCEYIGCDVSDDNKREQLISDISKKYKRIDVLVNNAGVSPKVRLDILETTTESYDRLLSINTRTTFFMSQIVSNKMIEFKNTEGIKNYSPRIINISSISSYTSSTSRGEYCISKAGISMITSLFADRLSEYNIPVFEIRPGIILTDMTSEVKEKYKLLIDNGLTPIRRFGSPEDVANSVLVLCSGNLDFCTGQIINADGGFHIRRL